MSQNPVDELIKYSGIDTTKLPQDELDSLNRWHAYCEELVPAPRQSGTIEALPVVHDEQGFTALMQDTQRKIAAAFGRCIA